MLVSDSVNIDVLLVARREHERVAFRQSCHHFLVLVVGKRYRVTLARKNRPDRREKRPEKIRNSVRDFGLIRPEGVGKNRESVFVIF